MKLIRKLLGRKESPQAAQPQPPQPSEPKPQQPSAPVRKARLPRVPLTDQDGVLYLYQVLGREIPLQASNISGSGVALRKSGMTELPHPAVGSTMEGALQIRGDQAPVRLKVVRDDGNFIGCRYQGRDAEAIELIRKHFRIELSANDMIAINPKCLKQPEQGSFSCYRGTDGTEIRVIEDEQGLRSFMIHFLGWHLEASRGKALEVGRIQQDGDSRDNHHKGSVVVREVSDAQASQSAVQTVLRLVELVPVLSENHRRALIAALRAGKT